MSYLPENMQIILRSRGIINLNETALKEGDLYVAINVINKQRRIIHVNDFILEGKGHKKLLKG